MAFVHDITSGFPREMLECDILYAEPPWRQGYDKFNDRAKIRRPYPYNAFLRLLVGAIESSGKPAIVVAGKAMEKALPRPVRRRAIIMDVHNAQAVALYYGSHPFFEREHKSSFEILDDAADTFECVGDPCCGYGIAARFFAGAGKRFIVSDVSPECIGYIAENAGHWR